jgi:hypothetical protein
LFSPCRHRQYTLSSDYSCDCIDDQATAPFIYAEYNRLPEKFNNPDEQAVASTKGKKHYAIRSGQASRLLAVSEQNASLDSQQKGVLHENSLHHKTVRERLHILFFLSAKRMERH